MRLLTTGNPKTTKSRKWGYHTGILHLHPDVRNCHWWTKGCREACLNTAGRAAIIRAGETTNNILECRKRRTRYMRRNPAEFRWDLDKDLALLQRQAQGQGLLAAVRLNGTSDLDWAGVVDWHRTLQFYDYTKSIDRMNLFLDGRLSPNYHLTFSRTERNYNDCQNVLRKGGNIAVVTMSGGWDGDNLLDRHGYIVNGDEHDLTFLHPPKSILVLKAKGRAKQDTTGFVMPF